jgi:ubiquinone/menaquinone biosynthesis C-methylase UbiE
MSNEGFQIAAAAAERYEQHVARFMLPFAEAIVDAAAPGKGDAVLDVACGTGFVTRRLLDRVGRAGRVAGADLNPGMVHAAGLHCPPGIEWVTAPAEAMPFADDEFDAVLCQQGVQFFPDTLASLREMRRVLRQGGTLVATVWAPMSQSPFMEAQALAMRAACGVDATASFWKAIPPDGDRLLADTARDAGFTAVEVRQIVSTASLPPVAEYLPAQLSATPWGPLFAGLDDAGKAAVVAFATRHLAVHTLPDGTVEVPFASHLLVAS